MIRPEVARLIERGPLPLEDAATEGQLAALEHALAGCPRPVTPEEARALLRLFGPDDCYGLAWSLLHLVETAPGGYVGERPPDEDANEWQWRLWKRWLRAQEDRGG